MTRAQQIALVLALTVAVMALFVWLGFAAQSRVQGGSDGGSWAATNGERVMTNQFQRFQ